ncbi:N-acetylglucosamine-6-phosphate deacetylase [Streptomonospora nanhaiensis]|uniref:N-acetylglucosamine-6-phosphate deacetylase n=1 Tax=Streptomonospora nanhaiensis TaxID=1323731 RepID=UPI001C385714|nr:N-acetylglucosamine-6-phosphate deacetylase [Streptomonospora nanhaiensis]MBV2362130.1 N-acetylglucosamine-6-phosphate deacetylase [Streptomonospora nanhaiensis]MBV2364798.1 N-acetylglucosamine-6-phosphate deacetylase [Streptomonospora nanhaiensis]
MGQGPTGTTLTNARLLTPHGVRAGWLRAEDGRINALGTGEAPSGGPPELDLGGQWVMPGCVDIHIHGGAGAAFTDADPERALEIVRFNRGHGVTTVVGGLVAAAPRDTLDQIAALAEVADAGELAGIYLEGPYIAKSKCGAHDPALLREPDLAEFAAMLKAGRGHIRMITVAPELPGALELIRAAASEDVVAAVGHTEATYDQTRAAFDAGATVATHIYNQMRPLHHREPGPIAAALNDERVTVELINDGVHVHPGAAALVFASAGAERVALVTDAMAATGLGDGEYTLGRLRVRVVDGQARIPETGQIASSTIVLPDAVRRAVHAVGVRLETAAHAATAVPARALNLPHVGSLTAGNRADLVVLDDKLEVTAVMHRGAWIREP